MRSKLPLLIVLAALLIFAILAFLGIRYRIAQISAMLPGVLRTELQYRLKRGVSFRSFELPKPGTAIISDLRVGERAPFGTDAFFSCPRIVVRFNLLDLLLGRKPSLGAITSITLVEPSIRLTRNARGEFNAQDIISLPALPPEMRFSGIVRVYSGRLTLADYTAKLGPLPAVNALDDLNARFDFGRTDFFTLDISGAGDKNRLREFRAGGRVGVRSRSTDVNIAITEADAPYWLRYFANTNFVSLGSGKLDARGALRSTPRGRVAASGYARLRGAAITSSLLLIPVTPFGADIRLAGAGATVSGRGMIRHSPILIAGRLRGFRPAALDLRILASNMDLADLQSAIRWPKPPTARLSGRGTLEARITGPMKSPDVSIHAAVPLATSDGVRVTDVRGQVSYHAGSFRMSRLTGNVAGGTFDFAGSGKTAPLTFSGTGSASGIRLGDLPILARNRVSGSASSRFTLAYARGSPTARADVSISELRVGGAAFSTADVRVVYMAARTDVVFRLRDGAPTPGLTGSASGSISVRGKTISVRSIAAKTSAGDIYVTGSASTAGALNLDVRAQELNLKSILAPFGYGDVAGTARVEGRVRGTVTDPRFGADVGIRDFAFRGIHASSATAGIVAARSGIIIRNPAIRAPDWSVVGSGEVRLSEAGPPAFDLRVRANGVDLSLLDTAMETSLGIKGIAQAEVLIAGRMPVPRISGEASIEKPALLGVALDRARIVATSAVTGTTIQEIVLQRAGMSILGQGHIGAGGGLDIAFRGESLNLSILDDALEPYLSLEGPMDLRARLTGAMRSPHLQSSFSSGSPKINATAFDTLSASVTWDGSETVISDATLRKGGAVYSLSSATFATSKSRYDLKASVAGGRIGDIAAVLQSSPSLDKPEGETLQGILAFIPMAASGALDASVTASRAPTAGTTINADLVAHDVALAQTNLGEVAATVRSATGAILFDRLTVAGPNGQIAVRGSVGPGDRISISGETKALSAAILKPWLPESQSTGVLDFGFTVGGTLSSPEMKGNFRATGIRAGDFCATSVTSPEFTIANGRLGSERVVITEDGSEAVISGYLPFTWSPPFIARDQPLMVNLAAQNQELSILKCFTKDITEAKGELDISASASGTLDKPTFSGNVKVADGMITFSEFKNSFTGLALSARLEGSMLRIENLSGASSLGGTFSGAGSVSLAGEPRTIQAFLDLMSVRLATAGSLELPEFTASGHLTASESLRSPLVQGRLVVTDVRIAMPAKEIVTSIRIPPMPVSPQLDVTVELAKNVVVERGALRVEVVGPLHISGTLPKPVINGTVQIAIGRLSFPGRTIEILPGGTASLLLKPPEPPVITVDITAMTTVTSSSTFAGRMGRYRVYFDMFGPIGDLSMNVRSSPPGLAGLEALATVFGGPALEAMARGEPAEQLLQQQLGQLLLGFAVPGLFQPLSFGGLTFGVAPGLYSTFELNASAFLTDKVVLTYTQSLVGNMPYSVFSASYSLNPRFAVSIQFEGVYWTPDDAALLLEYYKAF